MSSFDDWLHFSTFPTATTSVAQTIASYTAIEWNPNPAPPPGAVSETFVKASTTVIIAVPTTTTVITVANATITVAPGGTPINGPVPREYHNLNIVPPVSATSVTFTAPPAYTSVVAVPTASNSPPKNVTGPPGDKNKDNNDWWLLLFGAVIGGFLPVDVGIPGGTTPTATPPAAWTGAWADPAPSSSTHNSQSASSASSSSSCPKPTTAYDLPDDLENVDWDTEGTDPDRRRTTLERRAGRHIAFNQCGITRSNPSTVSLTFGQYLTIGLKSAGGANTGLSSIQVLSKPMGNGANTVNQEHVFELGYINAFLDHAFSAGLTCDWIEANVFDFVRADGTMLDIALINDIDTRANMVWVDKPLNQAKSNVVNGNRASTSDSPQKENTDKITDFTTAASVSLAQNVEYFARNLRRLARVGHPPRYCLAIAFMFVIDFGATAAIFRATALNVQNHLAEVTPDTPEANLPVEFNEWLRQLVATYPAGCTSRATNVLNHYLTKMNTISTTAGPVPNCFPLFHTPFQAQGFTWQNLVPPAPILPACNIPGTTGTVILGTSAGVVFFLIGTYRTMGSGNTNHYALGPGASLHGSHYLGFDLFAQGASCAGAWEIALSTPRAGVPDANIALNCNGHAGKVVAPFTFVVNNQQLSCVLLNSPTGVVRHICAGTAAAASTCAFTMVGSIPGGTVSTPAYSFSPS
ncbi:hypothetical protein B0H19DRAFT_1263474 [Mycena capillaripes]|nr:hypothetical protein B0H19DRAFT_1263474 [Mycena capillaripes]